MSLTSYPGSGNGGVTFKTANITNRLNNKGQSIGTGLKSGNHTTYFGRNGGVVSSLTAFR
ncbi:hypothetical protein CLCAR_0401 [Clostridium carboxidivorans P7]|nr:hypothetical protein [Clostridium carboxidivorans]EFG90195.1 hypothetical protein CLCAR_0401 [Clostridium carboxidivorans P7]